MKLWNFFLGGRSPTPEPIIAIDGWTNEDGGTLEMDSLRNLLIGLGFEPTQLSERALEIRVDRDGWTIPILVSFSLDKVRLWLSVSFDPPISDLQGCSTATIAALLRANNTLAPAQFAISSRGLYMALPLNNWGITPARIRKEIDCLDSAVRDSESLWHPSNFPIRVSDGLPVEILRFGEASRWVVAEAFEEAKLRGHEWVGTEHVLLSLLREPGATVTVLPLLELRPDLVRETIETLVPPRVGHSVASAKLTQRASQVLVFATEEAKIRKVAQVEIAHLVLGLLTDNEAVAAEVLRRHGVTLEMAKTKFSILHG